MQQTETNTVHPPAAEQDRWLEGRAARHREYLACPQPRSYALIPTADLPLLYLAARHGAYLASDHAPKVIVEAHLRRLFEAMDAEQRAYVRNTMLDYRTYVDRWVAAGGMDKKQ